MEEEVLELADDLIVNRKYLFIGIGIGVAVAAPISLFVGYRTSMKILEPKYASIADEEIKEAKAFYQRLHKTGDLETPEKAVETLHGTPELRDAAEALLTYQGKGEEVEKPEPEEMDETTTVVIEETNVFVESHTDHVWDYEAEKAKRVPGEPYLIHEDEWSDGHGTYQKVTLTYYKGDNTLADEKDEAIPTIDDTIGLPNLERFGHGTEDARVMFIRNERLNIDFEVLLHDGHYAHEVLGFQHGERLALRDHKRGTPKFRE